MYPSLVTFLIGSWPSPRKRVLNRGLPLDPDLSSDYDRTVFSERERNVPRRQGGIAAAEGAEALRRVRRCTCACYFAKRRNDAEKGRTIDDMVAVGKLCPDE